MKEGIHLACLAGKCGVNCVNIDKKEFYPFFRTHSHTHTHIHTYMNHRISWKDRASFLWRLEHLLPWQSLPRLKTTVKSLGLWTKALFLTWHRLANIGLLWIKAKQRLVSRSMGTTRRVLFWRGMVFFWFAHFTTFGDGVCWPLDRWHKN